MNSQREVIYTRRRHALMGERIESDITNMIYDAIEIWWLMPKQRILRRT
jgi:preprotein translocase subunit SecA